MRTRLLIPIVILFLLSVSCGGKKSSSAEPKACTNAALKSICDRGKIVIGQSNQQPYGWFEQPGKLVGLDIDMVSECQKQLGLPKLEFVEVAFDGLIPGVQSGRFDIAMSGMVFRTQRAEVADPSEQLYTVRATILVKKGNPLNIHSLDDLAGVPGKIGGLLGAAEFIQLQDDPRFKSRVVGYDTSTAAYSDLEAGRTIAVADGEALELVFLQKNPDSGLEIATPFPPLYSIGTVWYYRKGFTALRDLVNGCIDKIKQDGTMATILQRYNYPTENITPVGASPGP
jgi:polar amino acid transport system substrate-binding protein